MQFQVHQGGIEKHATDIFEDHINTLRGRSSECSRERAGRLPPIVDRRIESVPFGQAFAFGGSAGDADRTASLEPRDLPNDRTHGASRTVDEHRFASPRPAHLHDAEVRSDTNRAERRQIEGD